MATPNNALLYNAAAEGLVAGAIKGRWLTAVNSGTPPAIGTPDPAYAALAAQVTALATEFDSKVPNDHAGEPAGTQAISVVTTGVAIVPSTGAIQFGELIKTRLMAALSISVLEGRPYTALTSAELSAVATAVSAIYLDAAAFVVQPANFLVSVNNQLLIFAAFAGAIAGMNLGGNTSFPTDTQANVTQFLAYALALAEAIDALVANDASISASAGTGNGGAAIAPEPDSDAVIQLNQLGKVRLMYSCVLAYLEARSPGSITVGASSAPANETEILAWGTSNAPAVVALYKAGLVNLQIAPVNLFNPELWNQAYCGYIEGVMSGRPFTATSSTDPNYVAVCLAAKAFATEVDTTVAASDNSGVPVPMGTSPITFLFQESPPQNSDIVPTTGNITEAQNGKGGLMWAICRGVNWGDRFLVFLRQITRQRRMRILLRVSLHCTWNSQLF